MFVGCACFSRSILKASGGGTKSHGGLNLWLGSPSDSGGSTSQGPQNRVGWCFFNRFNLQPDHWATRGDAFTAKGEKGPEGGNDTSRSAAAIRARGVSNPKAEL